MVKSIYQLFYNDCIFKKKRKFKLPFFKNYFLK